MLVSSAKSNAYMQCAPKPAFYPLNCIGDSCPHPEGEPSDALAACGLTIQSERTGESSNSGPSGLLKLAVDSKW
jgi:hypothetical protein